MHFCYFLYKYTQFVYSNTYSNRNMYLDPILVVAFSLPAIRCGDAFNCYYPTTDNKLIEYDFDELVYEANSPYQNIKICHSPQFGNMLVLDDDPSKYQIKSNQIKSNQIKSNQIKSNQIKSNQIKSNQIKSNQIKSNQIKSNFISQQQNDILHKQTTRTVLLRGGHMAHFVPSSCDPKT